ncbi:helix-turn-helix domain-containing protein [Arundinibacter roseus]|uniref:Helix-turn-helix domain-containing protein n=1 Tax=Arundinibacter roseus TaxID=2070510 RepID=A0A4R4KLG1_9BACT|nr:helix-turn-helix domain-containing protein [Arundinibacter roseus]TDB67421.1 helix-turn-helix domain-containing protein [Arundinibacter roseus]
MKTGQLIKELRLKKGITQEDLAAKTDISVRTIQRIESGEVDPRAYTLQSIAAALDVAYEVLIYSTSEGNAIQEKESSRWLPILHLSGLLLLIFPPILVWIWKRDEVPGIRRHAVEVLNFQLSMSLYFLVFVIAFSPPLLLLIFLFSQVMIILNSVKVTSGQPYKYPLSIRFLKQEMVVQNAYE